MNHDMVFASGKPFTSSLAQRGCLGGTIAEADPRAFIALLLFHLLVFIISEEHIRQEAAESSTS